MVLRMANSIISAYETDRSNGFVQLRNIVFTCLLGAMLLLALMKFVRVTFFSYRRYLKPPISTLCMHGAEPSFMRSPSVSTITFFRGAPPLIIIRRRIIEIIKANPWLTARLVYEEGKYSFKYSEDWDSDSCTDHFQITYDKTMGLELDYITMVEKVSSFIVGNGKSCLNSNEVLFKVSVIQSPSTYALVVSISHILVDGRTFYNIYEMLSPVVKVRSLIAARVMDFPQELGKLSQVANYFYSVPFVLRVLYFMVFSPKTPNARVFVIDKAWIEKQKKKAISTLKDKNEDKSNVISSNDILVSWWASRAKFEFALMAVNFRERLCSLTQDHAGNYSGAMVMYPNEFSSPSGVRKKVSNFLKVPESVPDASMTMRFNCGICTNWSSFYSELEFKGSTLLRHLPIFSRGSQRFSSTMVIFCPRKGELAALVGSSVPGMTQRLTSDIDGPCGDQLLRYCK